MASDAACPDCIIPMTAFATDSIAFRVLLSTASSSSPCLLPRAVEADDTRFFILLNTSALVPETDRSAVSRELAINPPNFKTDPILALENPSTNDWATLAPHLFMSLSGPAFGGEWLSKN